MKLYRNRQYHISRAKSEIIPLLAQIHENCFDQGWSEDDLSSMLRANGVNCFVASLSGKEAQGPKGFIILRTIADQSEILTIATDPKNRKRGIGKALLEHAIRQLQSDRVAQLFLEVSETNKAALKLYNSLNFKQISVRRGYYARKSSITQGADTSITNALVMQLELR